MGVIAFQAAYYLEGVPNKFLAIKPSFEENKGRVRWLSGSTKRYEVHCRQLPKILDNYKNYVGEPTLSANAKLIKECPSEIIVINEEGKKLKLTKLTKELFDEKVKDHVLDGPNLEFKTDQEVQDFYLRPDFMV
ncbi:MAG: hypothetical protein ACQEP8_02255 [Chlamydiota bacterium]